MSGIGALLVLLTKIFLLYFYSTTCLTAVTTSYLKDQSFAKNIHFQKYDELLKYYSFYNNLISAWLASEYFNIKA